MFCLHVYLCTACYLAFLEARGGRPIPLGLKLQMVLSYCVGARNGTQDFWKRSQWSYQLSHGSGSSNSFTIAPSFGHPRAGGLMPQTQLDTLFWTIPPLLNMPEFSLKPKSDLAPRHIYPTLENHV